MKRCADLLPEAPAGGQQKASTHDQALTTKQTHQSPGSQVLVDDDTARGVEHSQSTEVWIQERNLAEDERDVSQQLPARKRKTKIRFASSPT